MKLLQKDLLLTQALAENELLDKLEKSRDMRDKYGL